MKIETSKIPNYIINVLTTFLVFSFISLYRIVWGKYLMLFVSIIVFAISSNKSCGGLKFKIRPFHLFLFFFALYCGLSSLWAIKPIASITDCKIMFSILICFSLIYAHYQKENNLWVFMDIIKNSGLMMVFYSFYYYGIGNIFTSITGERMGTEFANTNKIGMVASITCLLEFYDIICKRRVFFNILFFILTVTIALATQTRTALICLLLGIIGLSYLKSVNKKSFLKSFIRIIVITIVFITIIYVIMHFFRGYAFMERIMKLFSTINGDKKNSDHSALVRLNMIKIGMDMFREHPFLGVGMKNSGSIVNQYIHRDTYLHNNFVELLCCGGIVGFVLYYSIYVYLFHMFVKYRKNNYDIFIICFSCMVTMLLMDYGTVSYYIKQQNFYLMTFALIAEKLKKGDQHEKNIDNIL